MEENDKEEKNLDRQSGKENDQAEHKVKIIKISLLQLHIYSNIIYVFKYLLLAKYVEV